MLALSPNHNGRYGALALLTNGVHGVRIWPCSQVYKGRGAWSTYLTNCAKHIAMVFEPHNWAALVQGAGEEVLNRQRGDQLYIAMLEMYGQGRTKRAFPISQEVAVALCDAEEQKAPPLAFAEWKDAVYDPEQDVYRAVWAKKSALPSGHAYDWLQQKGTQQKIEDVAPDSELEAASRSDPDSEPEAASRSVGAASSAAPATASASGGPAGRKAHGNWSRGEDDQHVRIPKNDEPQLPAGRDVDVKKRIEEIRSQVREACLGHLPQPPPVSASPSIRGSTVVVVSDSTLALRGGGKNKKTAGRSSGHWWAHSRSRSMAEQKRSNSRKSLTSMTCRRSPPWSCGGT